MEKCDFKSIMKVLQRRKKSLGDQAEVCGADVVKGILPGNARPTRWTTTDHRQRKARREAAWRIQLTLQSNIALVSGHRVSTAHDQVWWMLEQHHAYGSIQGTLKECFMCIIRQEVSRVAVRGGTQLILWIGTSLTHASGVLIDIILDVGMLLE